MTVTETQSRVDLTEFEQEVSHYFCCRSEDVSLCGLELEGRYDDSKSPLICVECREIDKSGKCPYGYECQR